MAVYSNPPPTDALENSILKSKKKRREVSQTYWAAEQRRETESAVQPEIRHNLIQQHGDFSLAYSLVVQPRLKYFGDDRGFIAFRKRWGITFVLGDVVTSPDQIEPLIERFLSEHKRAVFCQASQQLARRLVDRGFYANEMGVDTTIDLADYNFNGKQKEWLRYAANWCARRDYRIVEASFDEVHPDEVENVSEAWRKTRTVKQKEVRFLNRPIVLEDEPNVRKFFFYTPDDQLQALVFLDPIYRDGQLIGFVTCIKRRHPDAPIYSEQAIMKHIIEKLQSEGLSELKLGLSPLAWIDDDQLKNSAMTSRLFKYSFQSSLVNRFAYHLKGHAEYKRRFRGREEKLYLCSQRGFSPFRLMALIGVCGLA